jgi:hypothetical protein
LYEEERTYRGIEKSHMKMKAEMRMTQLAGHESLDSRNWMKEARKACPSQPWRNGAQPGQHFPEL